jgi:hypothetical protein
MFWSIIVLFVSYMGMYIGETVMGGKSSPKFIHGINELICEAKTMADNVITGSSSVNCRNMNSGSRGLATAFLVFGLMCWISIAVHMILWRTRNIVSDMATDPGTGHQTLFLSHEDTN